MQFADLYYSIHALNKGDKGIFHTGQYKLAVTANKISLFCGGDLLAVWKNGRQPMDGATEFAKKINLAGFAVGGQ